MALIGQPSPDDVYELNTDLLETVSRLRQETKRLKEDRDYYRNQLRVKARTS